jgi:hypothetical protein
MTPVRKIALLIAVKLVLLIAVVVGVLKWKGLI